MPGATSVDHNAIIDDQRMGGRLMLFITICVLAMASDGYDLASLGYIQPELLKQWHLGKTALAPAFSAGIIGLMIGGPVLGILGDRFGRKPMLVAGLVLIGVLDLITTTVRGTTDLAVLRFATGLMVGGVFPNAAAMAAEVSPRRFRGRVLVIASLGVVLGIALPGLVANRLVPTYGWKAILLVGGATMLTVAALTALLLPESLKYMVERGGREAQALRLARRLRPDLSITQDSRFALPVTGGGGKQGAIGPLFAGPLALVTPLLWVCQACNQMANFFSLTWLPTLLQAGGASTSSAGATAPLFAIGGLLAGGLLVFVIERLGVVPLVGMFLVGVPLVAEMAAINLSPGVHALVIAGAGFCVTGIQCGLTALLGLLYPTPIRSVGTGWTQGAGRLGALAAPVVGSLLLGLHIAPQNLPLAPAALLLVGGVACIVLTLACRRQFGGFNVEEFPLAEEVAKVPLDPVGGTI